MPLRVTRQTAVGRGAVAVLQVITDAQDSVILDRHFVSVRDRKASTANINQILYGHWHNEDVVLVRTSDTHWEIQCHGGEAAVNRIAADLGVDELPDALTGDANAGSVDEQLMQCLSLKTAQWILPQAAALKKFRQQVAELKSAEDAIPLLSRFLSWQRFADHLTKPWNVAIVGRPNAGKSSLLNAMVGFERSIVFDQPGTTRDGVEFETLLHGYPFRLIDTAGVRTDAPDPIEAEGIQVAVDSLAVSDAIFLVVDSTIGWTEEDSGLWQQIPAETPTLIVWNKSDQPSDKACPPQFESLQISMKSGDGIDAIIRWLSKNLLPVVPEADEPLPLLPDMSRPVREFLAQFPDTHTRSSPAESSSADDPECPLSRLKRQLAEVQITTILSLPGD